ncbi:hypothetical protein X963_5381 [Burkholderia pseudomallei MSHR7498]|nr:hypothetical protein X963_5381 [Burkholderia pseudomallei MSHR7498]
MQNGVRLSAINLSYRGEKAINFSVDASQNLTLWVPLQTSNINIPRP